MAGTLLALLGPDRAGDLIEALLDRLDASDGDTDLEQDSSDSEEDDPSGGNVEDEGEDDSNNDSEESCGPNPAHVAKIRRTRCTPRYRDQWMIGQGRMWSEKVLDGYDLREPRVSPALGEIIASASEARGPTG